MWYLDNEANNHMTGDQAKFKEFDEKLIGNVNFGDRSIILIQGRVSVLFKCKNSDQLLLTKVYIVSSLMSNIIIHGQMTEKCSRVELIRPFLKMFDRNEALLMKVKRLQNCLHKILMKTINIF